MDRTDYDDEDFSRKKKLTPAQAAKRLAVLCARSEVCESEVKEKCRRWGVEPDETETILLFLRKNSFVDNRRYAEAFARDRFSNSGWGPAKIRQALLAKRIDSDTVSEAISFLQGEEARDELLEALKRAAASKTRTLDLTQTGDRQKLVRFLMQRGFPYPLIKDYLHTLEP